jgi:hypothetical protein
MHRMKVCVYLVVCVCVCVCVCVYEGRLQCRIIFNGCSSLNDGLLITKSILLLI